MKNNKVIILLGLFVLLFFVLLSNAYSDSYRSIVYEQAPVDTAIANTAFNYNDAIASAASNDHSFDFATNAHQLDFNCSRYSDSTACSIAYAKRAGRLLLRTSASAVKINDPIISVGFGLRF